MRAREGREHQLARIRMSRMYLHLAAPLVDLDALIYMLDGQRRIDSLGKHVVGNVHDIHVTGPLTVAEQCAFHALRSRQQRQLRTGHAGSPVVVGMHAQDDALPVLKMRIHPLDLIRVHVGRIRLHRGRQIDDHRILFRRAPLFLYGGADLQRVIQLRSGKALR